MVGTDLRLLVWLSPSFPVGAFAFSHGLEWAFDCGDVTNAETLADWIGDVLDYGAGRNDALLLALTLDRGRDPAALSDLAELAIALSPSAERRLETAVQGNAFLLAIEKSWPCDAVAAFRAVHSGDVAYPVAVGIAAAGHGIIPEATVRSFLVAFVMNLLSAAVRLGVVGQTQAQTIAAGLLPRIEKAASKARLDAANGEAALGGSVFRADIASMRHETQYSRLFRS